MEIRPTCTYPIFLEDVTVNRHIFFVGLSSIETSNLQKLDWYISTKHVYVSDEHNIWKSPYLIALRCEGVIILHKNCCGHTIKKMMPIIFQDVTGNSFF
jgi:hypothetical protein